LLVVLWFLGSFSVYMSNGRTIGSGDTVPASLIPITIILDGTVMLDRFNEEERRRFANPYWLLETPHGVASLFPITTGLLAVPIYALPVLLQNRDQQPSPDRWRDLAVETYQKPAAALYAALAVAVFWSICSRLGFSFILSILLTGLFAFGSQTFATSSQALWQHGPGSLAVLATIRCLLALDARPVLAAVLLSLFAGLAFAIRPNNLLIVAPFVLGALYNRPHLWLYLVMPGLMLVTPIIAYNKLVSGNFLGGYGLQSGGLSIEHFPAGFLGSLFSPGRGLFVYFPAALLALVLILSQPAHWRNRLVLMLATGVVLTTGLISVWWDWGGGHCFGPRFFTEVEGPILLMIGLVFPVQERRFAAATVCLTLILVYSVFVQFMGTFNSATIAWNRIPDRNEKARLWNFDDNPIFRGIRANL
jgi:hypothetical protein